MLYVVGVVCLALFVANIIQHENSKTRDIRILHLERENQRLDKLVRQYEWQIEQKRRSLHKRLQTKKEQENASL